MSWTTGTQTEALSANSAVGSSYNNFSGPEYVGPSADAAAYLPANFFLPAYGRNKTIFVKGYGIISTTSTPNLTIGLSANSTQGTYNSGGILATTGAVAQASSITNAPFDLECLITCVSTGGSGTFLADGRILIGTTIASAVQTMRLSSSSANPNTAATLSTESAYYIEPFATWGSASSSNAIQFYSLAVLGIN